MGKNLADLLKFKKEISIVDPDDKETVLEKVWVRLLGDEDIKEAYKFARIASAEKRSALRDKTSDDYKDAIAQLYEVPKESLIYIMKASRESTYANEGAVIVVRPDLPKMEELAVIPDAPTLEEQERLDASEKEVDAGYQKEIKEYIETKLAELEAELNEMSESDLFDTVSGELINIQSMEAFGEELRNQKGYRGTYYDNICKERAFTSIEHFKSTMPLIKEQILVGYESLEMGQDDLKN